MPGQPAARALALALALLLAGCALPRPAGPPAQPPGARRLLAALEVALQRRSPEELAMLFTAECRNTCRGFVPHPVAAQGLRIEARWTARIDEGDLLEDLARALLSYARVRRARLEPRQWRSYQGVALVRAQLRLEGEDREGRALVDRGLIDLTLQRGPAGWRINELVMARVSRIVELRAEEAEALAAGDQQQAGLAPPTSRPESAPPPPPERPAGPEPGRPAEAGAGGDLLPSDLLSLVGRAAAGRRATLLLVSERDCPECKAVCSRLARLVQGRGGCSALSLRLDADGGAGQSGCSLRRVPVSREARAALARLRSLLPLLVLLDGEGRPLRLFSGAAPGAELEAELDRRCPR